MKYKCVDCGAVFEEDEVAVWEESRGEFWGVSCSETVSGCPACKGDYDEAFKCKRCGEWCFEDELEDGLCESCQEETED